MKKVKVLYEVDSCEFRETRNTFAMEDLKYFMKEAGLRNDILNIGTMEVPIDLQGQKIGSNTLNRLTKAYDDHIIIAIAGHIGEEEPEDLDGLLKRLNKFYTNNEFLYVNDKIAHYEQKHVYIKANEPGLELMKYLITVE